MPLPTVRNLWRAGVGLLSPIVVIAALAGSAAAAALDPTVVQVQYLPRDGAAIIMWNPVDNATGYNVFEQVVTPKEGSPSTATAPVKVNTALIDPKTPVSFFLQGMSRKREPSGRKREIPTPN